MQANLGVQGANEIHNNIYNMIRQYNSQSVEERLIFLEESLHHANPKSNTTKEAVSLRNKSAFPEPTVTH